MQKKRIFNTLKEAQLDWFKESRSTLFSLPQINGEANVLFKAGKEEGIKGTFFAEKKKGIMIGSKSIKGIVAEKL